MFQGSRTATQREEKQYNDHVKIVGSELAKVLPQDDRPWYKKWYLIRLNLILLSVPLLTSSTVGYDGAMMNALLIAPFWRSYFSHPAGGILGLINAIFPVGKMAGVLVTTPFSNKFGRVLPIRIGAVICILGAALQGASQNLAMFIVSRWIIGFGAAFMATPAPILITELSYPTLRAKATALYNTFYFLGAIFAAWSVYGTVKLQNNWSWRIPSLLQGFFPVIQLLSSFTLPESPRWLIANGRVSEARAILVRHHGDGDESSPLVAFEMHEIEITITLEREQDKKSSFKKLFATPANRKRVSMAVFLGFFAQWAGNGVIAYYLSLVLNTIGITKATDQALINGLLNVFNFFITVFAGALMIDRLGRRTLFLWSTAGMCLSYVVWTALNAKFVQTKDAAIGIAVIPMIFVYYFHYDIAVNPITYAYIAEIFPYELRGLGISITYFSTYLGLMFNLFANPIAMKSIGWKYYIVYVVINALAFCIIWIVFPETRGHSLEEIALIFEGEGAAVSKAIPDLIGKNEVEGRVVVELEERKDEKS